MSGDVSPILDRHTQEKLGQMLRDRLDDAHAPDDCEEIDALLASLRAADERGAERRSN